MKHFALMALLAPAALGACVNIQDHGRPAPKEFPLPPPEKVVLVPGNALYSAAVGHGDTVYLAGIIGRSETGDVREATRQAMDTVKGNLEKAGAAMEDLLKCTVFMTDIEQYGPMNEVYTEYFANVSPPARTAVAVSALPFGALVEVECIAAR